MKKLIIGTLATAALVFTVAAQAKSEAPSLECSANERASYDYGTGVTTCVPNGQNTSESGYYTAPGTPAFGAGTPDEPCPANHERAWEVARIEGGNLFDVIFGDATVVFETTSKCELRRNWGDGDVPVGTVFANINLGDIPAVPAGLAEECAATRKLLEFSWTHGWLCAIDATPRGGEGNN